MREKIGFLKIDAEGFGSNVIRGARDVIVRDQPTIAIEVDPEPLERIEDLLHELGYLGVGCYNATPTWVFQA